MSYVGYVLPNVAFQGVRTASFNGTGSQTVFTLPAPASSAASIEVVVNNVQQSPYDGSYSVNGSTLTFSEAPSSGTNNIYVAYRDQTFMSTVPGDGSVTPAKLSGGAPYWDGSGNVGVGTTSPTSKLQVQSAGTNYITSRNSVSGGLAGLICQNGSDTRGVRINNASLELYDFSAGASRLTIDASGRVTMPYQPAFEARMNTTGGSVTVGGAIATFNNIRVNTGSHFSGTRFTAPVTGNYQFGGIGATYNNSTFRMDIYANGSLYQIGCEHNDGVVWTIKGWSTVIRLNAGDYIEIKINGTVNQEWTSFSGHLIG